MPSKWWRRLAGNGLATISYDFCDDLVQVSTIFGTVGSAIVIALIGPALLRINLVEACKDYEEKLGGGKELGGSGTGWHRSEVRAFRVPPGGRVVGLHAIEAEALVPDGRVFVLRVRRDGKVEDATADTVLREGEVLAVVGTREVLLTTLSSHQRLRPILRCPIRTYRKPPLPYMRLPRI